MVSMSKREDERFATGGAPRGESQGSLDDNRLSEQLRIVEGIASGESAVADGRTVSLAEAKTLLGRWLSP